MARVILSGGTVVLPDSVVEGGSVVVEEGTIVAVAPRAYGRSGAPDELFVNAAGRLVLPGLVDLHDDAFETEINPRPRANLPPPFALANLDRRLAASGVTIEFNAIFFADMSRSERKLDEAPARVRAVSEYVASGRALADHHVLFRVDIWNPASLDTALAASEGTLGTLVSMNDHTPGQGQYRDVEQYRIYLSEFLARSETDIARDVALRMDRAREKPEILAGVLAKLRTAACERDLILMSHDDDTPERVDLMYEVGARIAEFPVTLEAARRQRELGMTITAGAPNIVRGGSASGNLSAVELLALGLLDVLCADYHAPSMLYAVLAIVETGRMSLPDALRLVTLNPACAARLGERTGSLETGKQADVIVVDPAAPTPSVALTMQAGRVVYYSPALLDERPSAILADQRR